MDRTDMSISVHLL